MEKWEVIKKPADFQALARKFSISSLTARLIYNRDIAEADFEAYLHGDLSMLHDPMLLKGMGEGVALMREKIKAGKSIRILGDYDIDGVNATHILLTGLLRLGAVVDTVIPDRMKDGYGINEQLVQKAYEEGVDTIITCDNGIAAIPQIAYAKALGMMVIVTDHHDVPYEEDADGVRRECLPEADVVINPKQAACPYPFKKLCGAAVAFKLIQALYAAEDIPKEEAWPLIEYAAIATVGDIMDLQGENRILVSYGLKLLQHTKNLGLQALMEVNGLAPETVSTYHIGFVLGPCLNASGRLDTAKRALALLGAETKAEADRLAGDLKSLNDSRKDLTRKGVEEALSLVDNSPLKDDRVLIIFLPDCHESLAGIIAGRVKEAYHKPCFVLTRGEEGVKGSGRSIEGYHMFQEMSRVSELFTKFGGHPMAAGLSMKEENVEVFRQRMNENCTLTEEDFIPKVEIDAILPIQYVGGQLLQELSLLEPFGKGNQKPLFAETDLLVLNKKILGKNQNVLKLRVQNKAGCILEALYFGNVQELDAYLETRRTISVVYYPSVNEYMGNRTYQIVIQNYR